jgi:hypothetical protein
MNKAELTTALKDYLNRPNLLDEQVSLLIAIAEGELNAGLVDHPRNIRRASFTQTAGNSILPLPTDVGRIITLRTDTKLVDQYSPASRSDAIDNGNAFIAVGDCLELIPAPSVDTTYYLVYSAFLSPLATTESTNWVSVYFPDLYLYACLKESSVYLKDDKRLAQWAGEYLRRLDGLQAQGWNQNIQTLPLVR